MEERWEAFNETTHSRSKSLIKTWWISDHGRVKITNNLNDHVQWPSLAFTGGHKDNRYLAISINNAIEKYVHRLVARFFIPNPYDLSQVNHIDGVKSNNHYQNLEWVTCKQNVAHYHNYIKITDIDNTPPENVLLAEKNRYRQNKWLACLQLREDGLKVREIAEALEMPAGSISCILWKIQRNEGPTAKKINRLYAKLKK